MPTLATPASTRLWLPKSGRLLRDAEAFEEYLNSPMNTRPEDLLTRIHVPLRE